MNLPKNGMSDWAIVNEKTSFGATTSSFGDERSTAGQTKQVSIDVPFSHRSPVQWGIVHSARPRVMYVLLG